MMIRAMLGITIFSLISFNIPSRHVAEALTLSHVSYCCLKKNIKIVKYAHCAFPESKVVPASVLFVLTTVQNPKTFILLSCMIKKKLTNPHISGVSDKQCAAEKLVMSTFCH